MKTTLPLRDILAAIDLDGREAWDEFTDEEKKSVVFYTLNRYISSVKAKTEIQEHYVLVTNERFNKNMYTLLKEPKLAWQIACSCNYDAKTIFHHEWISMKKQSNKKIEFLKNLHPDSKIADIETLAEITSTEEIKKYCEKLGWDKKQIAAIKF